MTFRSPGLHPPYTPATMQRMAAAPVLDVGTLGMMDPKGGQHQLRTTTIAVPPVSESEQVNAASFAFRHTHIHSHTHARTHTHAHAYTHMLMRAHSYP